MKWPCYSSSCVVVFNASGPFKFRGKNELGDKNVISDLGGVDKADKAYFPLCAHSV